MEASEKLGYSDLSEIISVESFGFFGRAVRDHSPSDLKHAVDLLTLAMQLPPPRSLPYGEVSYRAGLYGQRGTAFLNLGQYPAAIDDFREVLDLLKESNGEIRFNAGLAYVGITLCYLRLGDVPAALKADSQWQDAAHDKVSTRVRELIQADPQEAMRALEDILRAS
jgi:tetratricopeptide (TPR) repeat protein